MTGILRMIIRLGNSAIKQQEFTQVRSSTFFSCTRNSCAYFSSHTKAVSKMTENCELFQPLPTNVTPQHYEVTIIPNLTNFKFCGKESIHVKIHETTDTILLNASTLEIKNVVYKGDDGQQMTPEKCDLNAETEICTIKFPKQLTGGKTGKLYMEFDGILDNNMKGFYRCTYTSPEGETKYSAVTQFETTYARKCFPCWDEPAHKATFDITMTVQKDLTALSNMPVEHKSEDGDMVTLKYFTTPKMSTYLVALVVGEFDYVEDKTDGVVIRVYTPTGKAKQGEFALEIAVKSLAYYNEYFGIRYPLPKLDCVAVPDFSAGAMENWGLVTFRESCLLFDKLNTSKANMQNTGLTITHELAHQWFGNLVTMKWWTDLWLNEGYATFTEFVCMGDLHPELDTWKQFVTDVEGRALELDALKSSHPIEVPIYDPIEIEEIFDDISYCKGASVIRMLYSWIGKEDFMKGMNLYLKEFSYRNAETEDLWRSLEHASSKPVNKVMPTWTRQTGFPLLTVEQRQQGNDRVLSFTQQRFLADHSRNSDETLWMVPVNLATSVDPTAIAMTTLVSEKKVEVTVPNVPQGVWIKVNPECIGFYRTIYSQDMLNALLPSIENKTLPALDRYGLLDDLFNSAKAGYVSTVDVLKLLQAYKQEDNYIVWNSIATCLSRIRCLISHLPFLEEFKSFSRNIYKDITQKVGWDAKPNESQLDTLLRSLILNRMVMLEDKDTIAEAKRRFEKHIKGIEPVPADLRSCVYRAIINNGDEKTFETMLDLYRKTEHHEEKNRILAVLGVVRGKDLLKKVLELSFSDEVRAQDCMFLYNLTSWSAESRDYTWEFVKSHWEQLKEKIDISLPLLRIFKCSTEDFVSEEKAKDVEEFYKRNSNPILDRPSKQSIEKILMNASWLKRDTDAIQKFLKSQ